MLRYDETVVQDYRKKAVTDLSQLEVGKTYYSNTSPREFVFLGILSHKEMCEFENLTYYNSDAIWIKYSHRCSFDNKLVTETCSASDRNIGDSYNPWLIFENKEDCEEYEKVLNPTFYNEDDGLDIDDEYDYHQYDNDY